MDLVTVFNYIGVWTLGSLTIIDLIAATTNAFNGTILADRRDHRRKWTIVGVILIGVAGGIGGGVARDILLNVIPSALTNPWYLILATLAALLALQATKRLSGHGLRRTFDFMAAFSLPWYAIIGTQKALAADLPGLACVLLGIVGPTAGRYFIDITSGVTPQQFTRGEWFVGTAALTSVVYIILYWLGLTQGNLFYVATIFAWLVGFSFRQLSLHFKWEEPEPWEQDRFHQGEAAPAAE